jgi:hypothetical protein
MYGILNVAIFIRITSNVIRVILAPTLEGRLIMIPDSHSQLIFPDRLKDMKGFAYQVIVYRQLPRVNLDKKIVSHFILFLDALRNIQNSRYHTIQFENHSLLTKYWLNRKMHLTLNSGVIINSTEPKLMTYEKDGYCAMIPVPPKTTLTQMILIQPFDDLTWLLFGLSIIGSATVFWMFRHHGAVDSPLLLGYGIFVYFIGQGVDFSRRNRPVLTILIQLIILMIFVLSNAYEGVITSFMIQPMQENRLKTIDDLIASEYEINTDEAFSFLMKHDEKLKALESKIRLSNFNVGTFNKEVKKQRYVFIIECYLAEYNTLKLMSRGQERYYILPEQITSNYIELQASYLNAFVERMQYYMDLCFQAGLHHIWKVFATLDHQKFKIVELNELEYLKLQDLYQVFLIFVVGLVFSTLMLLAEVFLHECLKDLQLKFLAKRLKNRVHQMSYRRKPNDVKYQRGALYYIIHRHQKTKRLKPKRLKVRQIFVQSRNQDD